MITFAIGLGCDRGTSLETVGKAVEVALALANAVPDQVVAAASITLKMDEAALLALAQRYDWPLQFYPPEQLAGVQVPNPSETVRPIPAHPRSARRRRCWPPVPARP